MCWTVLLFRQHSALAIEQFATTIDKKGRQIITGSNLNLLKYFWQKHKRVRGSLTVRLIRLKIPSSSQSWQFELLTSQSQSHFTVKVWRESGQKARNVLCLSTRRVDVRPKSSHFIIPKSVERESDLHHVNLSPSVALTIVPMNNVIVTPSCSQGQNTKVKCIY